MALMNHTLEHSIIFSLDLEAKRFGQEKELPIDKDYKEAGYVRV